MKVIESAGVICKVKLGKKDDRKGQTKIILCFFSILCRS